MSQKNVIILLNFGLYKILYLKYSPCGKMKHFGTFNMIVYHENA